MLTYQANTPILAIDAIQRLYQRRTAWHRAEKTMTLQGKAICRSLCEGDKEAGSELFEAIAKLKLEQREALIDGPASPKQVQAALILGPLIDARSLLEQHRLAAEEEYSNLVWDLPIMEWWDSIAGVSENSLAAVIGSAGNLWHYPTVQKFWCRMGLAVMPDGRRHRNASNMQGMAGYNATRRSVMWNIGTSIMFAQTARKDKTTGAIKKEAGEYRLIYDARRAYEEAKNENGDYAVLAAAYLKSHTNKASEAHRAYKDGKLPKAHLKARAQRYMEKELLKRLWVAWREIMIDAKPPVEKGESSKPKASRTRQTDEAKVHEE